MEQVNTKESWMSKYPEPVAWERFEKILADSDLFIRETRKTMKDLIDQEIYASVFYVVLRDKELCDNAIQHMNNEDLYRFSRYMEHIANRSDEDLKKIARVEARKILFKS